LTDSEVQELKQNLLHELDQLDAFLAKTTRTTSGPFLLGSDFSAADACLIPTMERWRYQLAPPLNDIVLDQGRPHVAQWFQAMDALPAYANRVAGDGYSWTAVASTFARYFGGDEERDENVQKKIQTADAAAAKLRSGFSSADDWTDGIMTVAEAAQQAAHKLISNHEAVIADCTRAEPISQKELERAAAGNVEAANAILLQVAHVLTRMAAAGNDNDERNNASWMTMAHTEPMHVNIPPNERAEAAKAARTVAARLCVPRDIGAPAAKILRGVLSITANRMEQQ
jgi:glutathione S-transferase